MAAWAYWRIHVDASNGGNGLDWTQVTMRVAGVDQTSPTEALTAATASSESVGSFQAYRAFNDTAQRWASDFTNTWPQWIQYHFPEPVALDDIQIKPASSSGRSPRDFTILASEDGEEWFEALIVTGEAAWVDAFKTFSFTAPDVPPPKRLSASTLGTYVVYKGEPARIVRDSTVAAFAVYAPAPTKIIREGLFAAYVVYEMNPNNIPRQSTYAAYVVWTTGAGEEARTRAWTYTLDGHTFYVLDLGMEGTFVYDLTTQQWARFRTAGFVGWNMRAGTMWGSDNRIVAGDTLYGTVWELNPDVFLDEGFRDIEHIVTGGIMTRSRVFYAVDELRIAGSLGQYTSDDSNVALTLRFSDDNGETWVAVSDPTVEGGRDVELVWRSLGSFMAPGRVFEISDVGGMYRIDGADIYINNFDGDDD